MAKISAVLSWLKRVLPHLSNVVIDLVARPAGALVVRERSRARRGICPRWSTASARIQGRYRRRPADAALGGGAVVSEVLVRRFKCMSDVCPAVTFAEQVQGLTRPHGRRISLLRHTVVLIGVAIAARPAASLARRLGMPVG